MVDKTISSKLRKYRVWQYATFFLIGILAGATFLSAADVQSMWELDTYASALRVDTKTVSAQAGVVTQLDPDGAGTYLDQLGRVQIATLKPTVVMEFGGVRHTSKDGVVTDWDTPESEWETSDRTHYLHYFEFDVVVRTVAHERDANIAVPPLYLQTLFPYVEHEKVMVYPRIRISIQPELGNETFWAGWGNAYVVATEPILYNLAMVGEQYSGYWDATPQIQQPSLDSKCAVVQTITDTQHMKDFVIETWASLEAGVTYKYSQPLFPYIISGISGVQNVGLKLTIRFSFDLSRPVVVEQADPLAANLDVAPVAHGLIDSGFWVVIVTAIVALIVVAVLLQRKVSKVKRMAGFVVG